MFYLSHFYQILFKIPVRGVLYSLFLAQLVLGGAHFGLLDQLIATGLPHDQAGGYFYALISNKESVTRVQRDMSKLPGVLRVELLSTKKINEEVQRIVSSYKLDGDAVDLDVSGIKVVFDKEAKEHTKKVTGEYLVRLVGEDKVTLGPIKERNEVKKENEFIAFLRNWGGIGLMIFSTLLWGSLTIVIFSEVKDRAYLISQFQRRNRVAFKIMLVGSASLAALFGVIALFINGANLFNLALTLSLILMSNLVFLRRLKWEY